MPTFITRRFALAQDFRSVHWAATLQYNLLRSFCAGIILAVGMFLSPQHSEDRLFALAVPLIWPLAYLVACLPLGLLLSHLARSHPVFGFAAIILSLIEVAIGDPLVLLLHQLRPSLLPIERPPIIWLSLVIFVLKPEDAQEIIIAY